MLQLDASLNHIPNPTCPLSRNDCRSADTCRATNSLMIKTSEDVAKPGRPMKPPLANHESSLPQRGRKSRTILPPNRTTLSNAVYRRSPGSRSLIQVASLRMSLRVELRSPPSTDHSTSRYPTCSVSHFGSFWPLFWDFSLTSGFMPQFQLLFVLIDFPTSTKTVFMMVSSG